MKQTIDEYLISKSHLGSLNYQSKFNRFIPNREMAKIVFFELQAATHLLFKNNYKKTTGSDNFLGPASGSMGSNQEIARALLKMKRKEYTLLRSVTREPFGQQTSDLSYIRCNLRVTEWAYEYMTGKISMQDIVDRFQKAEWAIYVPQIHFDYFVKQLTFFMNN